MDRKKRLLRYSSAIGVLSEKNFVESKRNSRKKSYDNRKNRELSYADAIHLATAIMSDWEILYSSDPDFEDINTEVL